MTLRPLTLDYFPRVGRMVLVYGSLMPYAGPGRWDVALWLLDDDGVATWFGGRFRCEANVGCPSVVAWAPLPAAADVEAILAARGEMKV